MSTKSVVARPDPASPDRDVSFDRALDWLGRVDERRPDEAFQRRFLAGCAGIGLLEAIATIVHKAIVGEHLTIVIVALFTAVLVLLAWLLHVGVAPSKLVWANLSLISGYIFLWAIRSPALQREDLAWLALVPVSSVLASGRGGRQRRSWVPKGVAIAFVVGVMAVAAHRLGWTFHESIATGTTATLVSFGSLVVAVGAMTWLFDRLLHRAELENLRLRSLLPVCAWCRRIRDVEGGQWHAMERYMSQHGTRVTHAICPECAAKEFPER